MSTSTHKKELRDRRHRRSRYTLQGTPERPRLAVFRSINHIYVQIIDDVAGKTLVAASSVDKDFKAENKKGGDKAAAKKVGELIAKRAKEKGIAKVVFDRGGFRYHGRVKELAEGARAGGLDF